MHHLLAQATEVIDEEGGIPLYAYLFWLWVLVSLSVYGYRLVRKITGQTRPAGDAGSGVPEVAGGLGTDTKPVRKPLLPRSEPKTATPSASGPAELTPTQKLFQEELARKAGGGAAAETGATGATADAPAGGDAPARAGFFAPRQTDPDGTGAPAVPVAELLVGIRMPCDLAPVVSSDARFDGFHVAFITSTHGPAEVGQSLGDELERLGFTLRSLSDVELEARKPAGVLTVRLHPDARAATGDGGRLFPHAPPDSVAVELRS